MQVYVILCKVIWFTKHIHHLFVTFKQDRLTDIHRLFIYPTLFMPKPKYSAYIFNKYCIEVLVYNMCRPMYISYTCTYRWCIQFLLKFNYEIIVLSVKFNLYSVFTLVLH